MRDSGGTNYLTQAPVNVAYVMKMVRGDIYWGFFTLDGECVGATLR